MLLKRRTGTILKGRGAPLPDHPWCAGVSDDSWLLPVATDRRVMPQFTSHALAIGGATVPKDRTP